MKELSTKEQIKKSAKFLREFLREKYKIDLSHGHALEVTSNFFGYNDWNTASALSAAVSKEQPTIGNVVTIVENEKPYAAIFQTAGELSDFFTKFDRGTKVVVNEYKYTVPDTNNPISISDCLGGTMTSVCSITYDREIQNGTELCLELSTESERKYQLQNFGKSAKQTFEKTTAGRLQRRIKYLFMQKIFWNPKA